MINLTFLFLLNAFSVVWQGVAIPGSIILGFLFLVLLGVVAAIYFTAMKYSKILALEQNEWHKKIKFEKLHQEQLMKEIAHLKSELGALKNKLADLQEENATLNQTIKDLEEQIENLGKSGSTEQNDIIIEYYMNKKSDD